MEQASPLPAPDAAPLPQVLRVSTAYVPQQDRIHLAAELDTGEVQVLWLTQRMLRMLLRPLGQFITHNAPRTKKEQARRSYIELMEKVSRKQSEPIRPDPSAPEWLVEKVDVSVNGGVVELKFWADGAPRSFFEVDTISLRRWLEVVRHKATKARWPEQLWAAMPDPANTP